MNFIAKKVITEINKEDDFYMVGLSDDAFDPKDYVLFQKSINPDKISIKQNTSGVYFEVCGQHFSGYDLCDKVNLSEDKITITLKKVSNTPDEYLNIDIQFKVSKKALQNLKSIMNLMFKDTSVLIDSITYD